MARDRILSRLITYEPGASGQTLNARLQELSSENLRVQAARGYLPEWMKADPQGATAWLEQQERDPDAARARMNDDDLLESERTQLERLAILLR